MATGYMQKPLVQKLGIREGYNIIILNPPEDYFSTLGSLRKNIAESGELKGPLDLILFFTTKKEELENRFPILKQALSKKGILWVSWPKASAKTKTDLKEDVIREIGIKNGLVDVKIIALDEVWSGLKFVYRVKDR
jgi:hypothetical protein